MQAKALGNIQRDACVRAPVGVPDAGALEAASVLLSFAARELPPTLGTTDVDPSLELDLVLEPRPWEPGPTLSNSFGFGGHNGSLVLVPA